MCILNLYSAACHLYFNKTEKNNIASKTVWFHQISSFGKNADLLAYRFQNELNKPIYRKWGDKCWLSGTGGRLLKLITCLTPFIFPFFVAGLLHVLGIHSCNF